jgi:hypothetical protein
MPIEKFKAFRQHTEMTGFSLTFTLEILITGEILFDVTDFCTFGYKNDSLFL